MEIIEIEKDEYKEEATNKALDIIISLEKSLYKRFEKLKTENFSGELVIDPILFFSEKTEKSKLLLIKKIKNLEKKIKKLEKDNSINLKPIPRDIEFERRQKWLSDQKFKYKGELIALVKSENSWKVVAHSTDKNEVLKEVGRKIRDGEIPSDEEVFYRRF
ncbi:MAG: hypothetical protein ACTSVV_11800 [Promethearchaeota archaeon]